MTIHLVFYLYHALSGHSGGPVVKIEAMPSIATCEAVGAALKAIADGNTEEQQYRAQKSAYRCVVVGNAQK